MRRKRNVVTAALALASAAALAAMTGGASAQTVAPPPAAQSSDAAATCADHSGAADVVYADATVVFAADADAAPAQDVAPSPDPAPAPAPSPAPAPDLAPDVVRLPQLNINVAPPKATVHIDSPFITVGPGETFSIRPEGLPALKRSFEIGQWRADVNLAEGPLRAWFSRRPDGTFLLAQSAPTPSTPDTPPTPATPAQPAQRGQPGQPGQPAQPGQAPQPTGPANPNQRRLLDLYRAQLGEKMQTQKAAYLGVSTSPVPAPLRQHLGLQEGVGLVVDFVESGSPAEQAGVKQYDILKKFDDQLLVNAHQLAVLVRTKKAGEEAKLQLVRGGKEETVAAKLVEKDVRPLDDLGFWQADSPAFRQNPLAPPSADTFREWQGRPNGRRFEFGGAAGSGGGGGAGSGFGGGGGAGPRPVPQPGSDSESVRERMRSRREQDGSNDRTVMVWRDNDYVLTVTGSPQNRHLVATDKNGKVLFDGRLDGDGARDRERIPKEIRERLERMEQQNRPKPPGEAEQSSAEDVRKEVRIERNENRNEERKETRNENRNDNEDADDDKDDDRADKEDKDEREEVEFEEKDDDDNDEGGRAARTIRRGDVVQLSISDLQGPGVETVKTTRIRDGQVSLPYIGALKAEGLDPHQLEREIVKKYREARLIENATVSVELLNARPSRTPSRPNGGEPGER